MWRKYWGRQQLRFTPATVIAVLDGRPSTGGGGDRRATAEGRDPRGDGGRIGTGRSRPGGECRAGHSAARLGARLARPAWGWSCSRQQALAAKEFASRQALEQAVANRDQPARRSTAGRPPRRSTREANVDVLKASSARPEAHARELQDEQGKARAGSSCATIRAADRRRGTGQSRHAGRRLRARTASRLDERPVRSMESMWSQMKEIAGSAHVSVRAVPRRWRSQVDALPGRPRLNVNGFARVAQASGPRVSLMRPQRDRRIHQESWPAPAVAHPGAASRVTGERYDAARHVGPGQRRYARPGRTA